MRLVPLLVTALLCAVQAADPETFDIVLVGGGTAGSMLAYRLSEVTSLRVLLLEAGNATGRRWVYTTEPEAGSCGGQGCAEHPSKGLGYTVGSTYTRGNPVDYNQWAEAGATGWSYQDVLPYFKQWENNTVLGGPYHGQAGPVSITTLPTQPYIDVILAALKEAGIAQRDVNGAEQTESTMLTQVWGEGTRRRDMKYLLVDPAAKRSTNFVVRTDAQVTRVLFKGKTAVGVVYRDASGQDVEVRASREVVLAAGTFNTAKLLLLSGVGPKEDLARLGIPLVADLPVGRGLQQHFATKRSVMFTLPQPVNNTNTTLRGPIAISAFHRIVGKGRPDVNYRFQGIGADGVNNGDNYVGIDIETVLVNVHSRGQMTLNSTDPMAAPVITYNAFDNSTQDREKLINGMIWATKLADTETFVKAGIKLNTTAAPECAQYKFGSRDYWQCLTVQHSVSYGHQMGTCAIGTVLDPKLRVRGLQHISVADGSVAPHVVAGNTVAVALMIGEKAAAIIKERLGVPQ